MALATSTMLALGAAAASAGLGAINTNRTAKKADNVAAEGIRTQAANQRQVNARLNSTIDETRKSTSDDERATAEKSYLDQVQRQLGQAKTGLAARGLSSEFDELAATEGKQVGDYGNEISSLFARMDAPVLQRQGEGNSFGNMGMDLSRIAGNVQGDDFLNRLKQSQVKRNPWLDFASALAGGYAQNVTPGVSKVGSAGLAPVGTTYGSLWGTGRGLAAAGYPRP